MARTNPLSYAFWTGADSREPGSYSALEARRRIAEQMAKKSPFPKTFGEGLTYLGESIAEIAQHNALNDADRALAGYERGLRRDAPADEYRAGTPGTAAAPPGAVTPVAPAVAAEQPAASQELPPPPYPTAADVTSPPAPYSPRDSIAGAQLLQQGFTPPAGSAPAQPAPAPMAQQPLPPLPNALIAALRTPPVRGPDSPSNWGSGKLTEVPTDPSSIAPGTFGMPNPAAAPPTANVSVGRGDEMVIGDAPPPATPRTRVASLGGTPNIAAAAAGNAPIATDIAPMPQQMAQAQAAPRTTGPAVPSSAIAPAPDLLPSQQLIPPPKPQEMAAPGPAPAPPARLGPSRAMQYWEQFIDNPRVSPETRTHALRQYQMGDQNRKEIQAAQQEDYKNRREKWEQKTDAYEKFQREAHDRNIDQLVKLQGVEQGRATLEKMYFEQGVPRQQAIEKARLDILKATQETVEPKIIEGSGGQRFERPPGSPAGTPFTEVGGIPKSEKYTEEETKALRYWQRGYAADQQIGDTNVLESLRDSALNKIPLVGNYAIPDKYRSAKGKADQWLLANVRHESGASIRPDEIPAFYHNYFPVPGDDEKTMREKDARRATTMKGVYDTLGSAKPAGDRFVEERKARKVTGDVPEMTMRTNRKTGQRQIHLNGYWEDIP